MGLHRAQARKGDWPPDQQSWAEEAATPPPEEFLDPLVGTLMSEPVLLPCSKTAMDRSTLERLLQTSTVDPFTRTPLRPEEVRPMPELQARIQAWIKRCTSSPRSNSPAQKRRCPSLRDAS